MQNITYIQHLELIDLAAQESRLYHHNGGQAYIRVSMDSNVLMIIDHTNVNKPTIKMCDGSSYFHHYAHLRHEHSRRLREYGSMVEWFTTNWPELVGA